MDTGSAVVKAACADMLQKRIKNMRHQIKKKYYDNVAANQVSIKSPVEGMPDDEWQRLVELWSTARHKVCLYMCLVSSLYVFALMYVLLFTYASYDILFNHL
jgi:hypothetical protein